jgi:hypothetical protein
MKDKIRSWIETNFMTALLLTVIFSLSSQKPSNELYVEINNLKDYVCELENRVNIYESNMLITEARIEKVSQEMNDPFGQAVRYKSNLMDYRKFTTENRVFPNTKFEFQPYFDPSKSVISTPLLAALIAYSNNPTSPKQALKVNSAVRKDNPRSAHFSGNAIDIHHSSADEFLCWVETEEGRRWLFDYRINFYIEDNTHSKFLAPWQKRMDQYVLVNPRATGPHIHIYYVGA